MNALLEVSGLTKTYVQGDVATQVLRGIDFSIRAGEFVALLGPSGSGKSTLLSILGTLLRPTSGRLMMKGIDLAKADEDLLTAFRNRNIGFVFQHHHLLPDFTAIENVMFPASAPMGVTSQAIEDRAAMLLGRVGLGPRMHFKSTKLSGGQKQRVAVARALMNKPALVLADEPTGNLDRESAHQVMALLAEINAEIGTTFLISTHDPEIARRCHRRITVIDGRIAGQDNDSDSAPPPPLLAAE